MGSRSLKSKRRRARCEWTRGVPLGPWLTGCGAMRPWTPDARLPRVCRSCGGRVQHVAAYVRTVHAIDARLEERRQQVAPTPAPAAIALPVTVAAAPVAWIPPSEHADRILALVASGVRDWRALYRAAEALPMPRYRVERTLRALVATDRLTAHGPKKTRWYGLPEAPARPVAPVVAPRREVRDRSVVFEVVWNGQRGDRSLLEMR